MSVYLISMPSLSIELHVTAVGHLCSSLHFLFRSPISSIRHWIERALWTDIVQAKVISKRTRWTYTRVFESGPNRKFHLHTYKNIIFIITCLYSTFFLSFSFFIRVESCNAFFFLLLSSRFLWNFAHIYSGKEFNVWSILVFNIEKYNLIFKNIYIVPNQRDFL